MPGSRDTRNSSTSGVIGPGTLYEGSKRFGSRQETGRCRAGRPVAVCYGGGFRACFYLPVVETRGSGKRKISDWVSAARGGRSTSRNRALSAHPALLIKRVASKLADGMQRDGRPGDHRQYRPGSGQKGPELHHIGRRADEIGLHAPDLHATRLLAYFFRLSHWRRKGTKPENT